MAQTVSGTDPVGVVGVLGGMGPLATVDFLHKVVDATPATCDQDHIPVVVSSIPQVPDRTAAFRRAGPSPLPALIASGRRLVAAGAELIAIPCNTAHLWFDELQPALGLPMLHIVDCALEEALAGFAPDEEARIGLLGTPATLESGLYVQRRFAGSDRLRWLQPSADEIEHYLAAGIRAIKANDLQRGRKLLEEAAHLMADRGARAIVLGCTEIPLVLSSANSPIPVIDATAALARKAVAWSLAQRPRSLGD